MLDYQLEELSIELTNECHMGCIMCSSGSTRFHSDDDDLTIAEILDLIEQASRMGATVLSLSGGDPIMVDTGDLLTILRAAVSSSSYERILFYTTGVNHLLDVNDGRFVDSFRAAPADSRCITGIYSLLQDIEAEFKHTRFWELLKRRLVFVFSLHSHKPVVNDYIMGRLGAYNAVVNGIKRCVQEDYEVWVHMVPMLPNWMDAPGMFGLCVRLGVKQMSMLRFVPQTRGRVNLRLLALNAHEFEMMQRMVYQLSKGAFTAFTRLRLGCPIDFRHTIDVDIKEKVHPCHAGKDLILVRPNGDVHPCAAWKTLPDTDNVRSASLEEIWNTSHIFRVLRQYHEYRWKEVGGLCSQCKYQATCKSGCLAQRLHDMSIHLGGTPTIDGIYRANPDPLCPMVGRLKQLAKATRHHAVKNWSVKS